MLATALAKRPSGHDDQTPYRPRLSQLRRLSVATGLLAIGVVAVLPPSVLADRMAVGSFVAFALGTAIGWVEAKMKPAAPAAAHPKVALGTKRQWVVAIVGVTLVAAAAVQTWFGNGGAIAG